MLQERVSSKEHEDRILFYLLKEQYDQHDILYLLIRFVTVLTNKQIQSDCAVL